MNHPTSSCSCARGQPLSWLTLELFQLGDLQADERQRVEAHLEGCPCCRSCLRRIEGDRERQLPPLPAAVTTAAPRRPKWWRSRAARLALASVVASAAAAVLLAVLWPSPPAPSALPPARIAGYKGGDLAVALVRERQGAIQHDPTRFAPGDRFKVLATCPPARGLHGEVVVYQDAGASFPLTTAPGPLDCGNRRPLAGAFTLTGRRPAVVCLVVGLTPPSRQLLGRVGPGQLSAEGLDAVCLELVPAGR